MSVRLVRALVGWLLRVWYPRLAVRGEAPAEGPLIVAANHPNSIVDPLMLSAVLPRPPRWLAKAPLFDGAVAGRLLRAFGVIPVRRTHEGGTEAGREAVIDAAAEALVEGDALGIFPEGLTHDAARLAPLKTGVGRIAVRAASLLGEGAAVKVLPVVLHFPEKDRFRSEAVVAMGEPIEVRARDEPREVTARVAERLEEHLVHVEDDEQERLLLAVQAIDGPRLARELGVCGPGDRHLLDRDIAEAVRTFSQEHADEVEGWKHRALHHLDRLEASGLSAAAIDEHAGRAGRRRSLVALLGLPIWAWGMAHSWLPYRLASGFVRRKARSTDRTTIAWFGLAGGAFYFCLFWAAETLLVGALTGRRWAALFLLTVPPTALAARRIGLQLRSLAVGLRDRLRVGRDPELAEALREEREELRHEVEQWRERFRERRPPEA
jgi:1-acyl-sn-glycerol-3-phosphate acyltransferase